MNNKGFAASGILYSILILFAILVFGVLSILGSRKIVLDKLKNDVMIELNGDVTMNDPNIPELSDNMIPVRYNGINWIVANENEKWYDYESHMWANVVLVNELASEGNPGSYSRDYYKNNPGTIVLENDILAYYVWIPKYEYNINNSSGIDNPSFIDINFIDSNVATDDYIIHPAFTFDGNDLKGIWVGKFETTGSISSACTDELCSTANLTVKPNLNSIKDQNVSSMFYAARSMEQAGNLYGISNVDSHMMKNIEWGAVAYLTHSNYGKCYNGNCLEIGINNNIFTGYGAESGSDTVDSSGVYNSALGKLASTTSNVYGVYDMSGGANEYVMANMKSLTGTFSEENSGFVSLPDSKYYDSYSHSSSSTNYEKGISGDAIIEMAPNGTTKKSWYLDSADFVYSNYPWFIRGGYYNEGDAAGIFNFGYSDGSASSENSFRVVLIKDNS